MGGKNHQPCGIYLPESTLVSRCLSVARAELEMGNVALEDLILAELAEETRLTEPIVERLASSEAALRDGLAAVDALRSKMRANDFVGLPTLHRLDLDGLGSELARKGHVRKEAWNRIAALMRELGFYAVLDQFEQCIRDIMKKTAVLRESVHHLGPQAETGIVHLVLEENRDGNPRAAFAELYTTWTSFEEEFLASALLSTEVWYAFNGYRSLCPSDRGRYRAA